MTALLLFSLALGCGRVADWGTPSAPGAMLPHPAGWEQASGHGAAWLERGSEACVGCHEADHGASFCAECHDSYPHGDGWLDGGVHGEGTFGKYGRLQPCQDCHALEGSFAGEQLPCTACHGSYPHAEGWEQGGEHGAYLVARGSVKVACTPCHGQDLQGGDVSDACSSCHASYPHPAGWSAGSQHGHFDGPGRPGVAASGCQRCRPSGRGDLHGLSRRR